MHTGGSAARGASRRASCPVVLVVSDGGEVGHGLSATLDTFGATVACSGSASATLVERAPDVVVVEEGPLADGVALAREVRQRLPDAVVVVLTRRVTEADHVRAFTAGVDAYLAKPVDRDAVVATVRELAELDAAARQRRRDAELATAGLLLRLEQHQFAAATSRTPTGPPHRAAVGPDVDVHRATR
jgi:DNA-binding response OmpR family regulator